MPAAVQGGRIGVTARGAPAVAARARPPLPPLPAIQAAPSSTGTMLYPNPGPQRLPAADSAVGTGATWQWVAFTRASRSRTSDRPWGAGVARGVCQRFCVRSQSTPAALTSCHCTLSPTRTRANIPPEFVAALVFAVLAGVAYDAAGIAAAFAAVSECERSS